MDEQYLQDLWNWTTSQDNTFEERYTFDSWKEKIGNDPQYQQDFHKWVGSIDNTFSERRPYEEWVNLVKKKDEPSVSDSEPEEEAITVATEEVVPAGDAASLGLQPEPIVSPREAMKPTFAPSIVGDVTSMVVEGDLQLTQDKLEKEREVTSAVGKAKAAGIKDVAKKFSIEEHKDRLRSQRKEKQKEQERQEIIEEDTEFKDLLLTVNKELIGAKAETVLPLLNEKFNPYGFIFKTTGLGGEMDIMVSTQDGKKTIAIDLDPYLSSTESSEAHKLRDFITANRRAEKIEGDIEGVEATELLEEDALEKFRTNFFATRGLDYGTITKVQNEIKRLEDQNELIDQIKTIQYKDPNFEGASKEAQEEHPEIFTPDGRLKGTAAGIRVANIEKLNKLAPLAFVEDIQKSKEEFDATLLQFREGVQQVSAEVNADVNTKLKGLNAESIEIFGVPLENIPTVLPTQDQVDLANSLFLRHGELTSKQQIAADQYYNAKIFYNYQENKDAQQEYAGQWEGFLNQIQSGYARGEAADEILKISMGLTDLDDPLQMEEAARKLALLNAKSDGMLSSQAVSRFNSAKSFTEALQIFKMDPLEISTSLAANSLSMMLPMGVKIIPTAVVTGVGTGAAIGSFTGPGVAATALSGGLWGFKTGFGATSFALEYTNSILDAMREEGYDLTDPEQVEAALEDTETWAKGREIGTKRGLAIGLVDFMGASLAGKLVKPFQTTTRKAAMIGVESVAIQPGLEAVGEYSAQVAAGQEISGTEIFAESVGAFGHQTPNLGVNVYMKTNKASKIKLAQQLTHPEFVVAQSESGANISTWANNLNTVGLISDETNNKIQENATLKEKTESLYQPSLKEKITPKILTKEKEKKTKIFDLLQQRQQYEKNPDIFAANIKEINEEINAIVTKEPVKETLKPEEVKDDIAALEKLKEEIAIDEEASAPVEVKEETKVEAVKEPTIKDSQIPIKKETFTIESQEGEGVKTVEVTTNQDGSRDIVQKVDGDIAGATTVAVDNTVPTEEYVTQAYDNITETGRVIEGADNLMTDKGKAKLTDKQKSELGIKEEVEVKVEEVVEAPAEVKAEAIKKDEKLKGLYQQLETLETQAEVAEDIPQVIIAENLPKITPESARKETGGKVGVRQDINPKRLSKKGVTIQRAAEDILMEYGPEGNNTLKMSEQEIRDEIITLIQEPSIVEYVEKYNVQKKIKETKAEIQKIEGVKETTKEEVDDSVIDKWIDSLGKLKEEVETGEGFGDLRAGVFGGMERQVVLKAIDLTIGALKGGKAIAKAIEVGYNYLVENKYKGTKEEFENFIYEKIGKKKPKKEQQPYKERVLERQKEEDLFIPKENKELFKSKPLQWVSDRLTSFANSITSLRKKLFSARKRLPKSMFAFKEKKDAMIASSLKSVVENVEDFNRLYKKHVKENKLSNEQQQKLVKDFDAYLRGDKKVELPEDLKEVANTMRNQIDALSKDLINNGLTNESQVDKVRDNIGQYLHRSYEVYDNKNWRAEVQEEVKQAARNYLREQMRPLAESTAKKTGETTDQALDRLVDNEMEKMLNKAGADNFLTSKGAKIGTKDVSILKQREDIPEQLRALMGEYSDPMQNYARTILKLTSLVNNAKFLNQVKEAGLGTYFFEKEDAPKGFTTKIAADASATYDPLGGLYTSPEIAADMSSVGKQMNKALEVYMKLLSVTKWNKTIGSVGTHAKNVIGNLGFIMANGHYDVTEMYNAYMAIRRDLFPQRKGVTKAVRGELTAEQQKKIREKFKTYIELGLVNQSAGLGEIRDMFKAANFDQALIDRLSNKKYDLKNKAKRGLFKIKKRAEDYYQAEDDFFKIVAYENELSRYAKAEFGKNKKDLTPEELSQINQKVADIIKNVYPTYSRVPEAIKWLKLSPLVGNFVSFQAESYRTAFNTVDIAFKELKSKNPKIKKIGAKRLTGILSYLSAKTAITSYFGMAAGTGMSGVLGYLFKSDDEEEREKDFRRFVAPWARNSDVIILQASDGKLRYIDISASDPHGGMNKALNAFLSGENPIDAFAKGLFQTIEPFVGWDITTAALLNVKENKDNYGKPIYNPEESWLEITRDISTFMWKTIQPGTVSSALRIDKAEEVTPEILSMMTGFRIYEADVTEQAGYNVLDIKRKERLTNARKIYNSVAYKEESTQEEKEKAYKKANTALKKIYQEVMDDYNAAIRLGADPEEVAKNIKKFGGISKSAMRDIVKGILPEYKVKGIETTESGSRKGGKRVRPATLK